MLFGKKEPVSTQIIKVIRSHRRTMTLEITKEGTAIVRAPYLLPERKIKNFISDKADWIRKKQAIMRKRISLKQKHQYMAGESFLFLGKEYPLMITVRKRPALILSEYFELAETKRNSAKKVFTDWYKKNTLTIVTSLSRQYAERYSFLYRKIRVTGAKTRWGSCSSNGTLSFSWRLIMAPEEVVKYVVVHELAHLAHHNHSKMFWKCVEKMDSSFNKQKKWLRENGHQLVLD